MAFSSKKQRLRKVLSIFLSLTMILSIFALMPVTATAETTHYSGYTCQVRITVTNDADGWNSANVYFYGKSNKGAGSPTFINSFDIKNDIDDSNEVCTKTLNCGSYFPCGVTVYTDFGGGATWRCWEADVTLYVNGINVKSEHISASSSIFSSSDTSNYVEIDSTQYPYPTEFGSIFGRANDSYLPTYDTYGQIFQAEDNTLSCDGTALVYAYDKYGVPWNLYGASCQITNVSDPSTDSSSEIATSSEGTFYGKYIQFSSTSGTDHTSRYNFKFLTSNYTYSNVNYTLDTEFIFRHTLDLQVNGSTVFTKRDFSGAFTDIDAVPPTGYTIKSYTLSGSGVLNYDDTDGSYQYTFGTADGTVTAKLDPIKYTITFNNNGGSGSMTAKSGVKYDKSVQLASCTFSNSGYHFVGWNTEPDGSGDSYANRSFVQNLTTVNNSTVTLYAQWEQNVYDVTLVYPTETGMGSSLVQVPHGGSVPVDEILPTESAGGHYHLTTPATDLANITSSRTINLSYELVAHNYGAANITIDPTCTVDGEQEETCTDCGYTYTSSIPHSHQALETIPGVAATCTTAGQTEEVVCNACGATVTASAVIPTLGHDYNDEPEWEWAQDYSSAHATWTCSRCNHTESMQTAHYSEISHSDSGTDRIYSTTFTFDGHSYTGSSTYKNLYIEVPYIDENGNESTMYAASPTQSAVFSTPIGNAFFIDEVTTVTSGVTLQEDVSLILCDGAKLNINLTDASDEGILLYNSVYDWVDGGPKYYKDLKIYGQTEQTGELNISVSSTTASPSGIECGGYFQYGGKVTINVDTNAPSGYVSGSNAINASGYQRHNGSIEVHNGILSAYSENSHALFSYHNRIVLDGGQITAATGDSGSYGAMTYEQREIKLGCRNADDFINVSSYKYNGIGYYNDQNLFNIVSGQTLVDGEGHGYSGALSDSQIEAIGGKTMTLHSGHTYAASWDWSEGYNSATATIACTGCGISETETATVTSEITVPAGCGDNGVRTHTASVTYNNTEYTDTQIEIIPPTGNHTYGQPVFQWSSDLTSAEAVFTCSVCGTTHAESADINAVITTPATCTQTGIRTVTATVEFENNTYSDIQTNDAEIMTIMTHHAKVFPTASANGNIEYYTCNHCGKYFTYDSDMDTFTEITAADTVIPYFNLYQNGSEIRLTRYNGNDAEIVIPDTVPAYYPDESIRGMTITTIGASSFAENPTITKVTAGDGIQILGWRAFYACPNLQEVTIGNGLTTVNDDIFMSCTALRKVTCSSTGFNQYVCSNAFVYCNNVTLYAPHASGFRFAIKNNTVNCRHIGTDAHSYTHSWVWTETAGGYTVTDRVRCSNCAIDSGVLDADVTMTETAPFCGNAGNKDYTATVEYDNHTFTDTKAVVIPPVGTHSYGSPAWTWSSDNGSCTATFICTVCGHSEDVDAVVTEDRFNLKSNYTASAEFEENTYTTSKNNVTRESKLFVSGTVVTADNASDILGNGTASYDEATNTLTLNNASIEISKYSGSASGIWYNGEKDAAFNIVLTGTNTISDNVADSGISLKYGIVCFAKTPSYTVSGSGTLAVSMNASDSSVTYYGIQMRKAVTFNGVSASIDIPGTAPTIGFDLMYGDSILSLTNGSDLVINTGSNASTYAVSSNRNVKNVSVEQGCRLVANSGNAAFAGNIQLKDATKALGALVNTANSYQGTLPWDKTTALSTYKTIILPQIYDIDEDGMESFSDIDAIVQIYSTENDSPRASQVTKADIDGDGVVDLFDAAALDKLFNSPNDSVGDVNQDGVVNSADAAMVSNYVTCTSAVSGTSDLMDTSYLSADYADLLSRYGEGVFVTQKYLLADLNGDKSVDGFDVIFFNLYLNGVIDINGNTI